MRSPQPKGRETDLRGFAAQIQLCSLHWLCPVRLPPGRLRLATSPSCRPLSQLSPVADVPLDRLGSESCQFGPQLCWMAPSPAQAHGGVLQIGQNPIAQLNIVLTSRLCVL